MKTRLSACVAIIGFSFIAMPFNGLGQAKADKYKIDLKLMTPKISLGGESTNMVFVVTVTNQGSKPEAFGAALHYGYKKFHSQDYYMEAVDQNNAKVDIDGEEDLELFYDDQDDTSKNMNKISQKIITSAYNFTPGQYKIRWVYDPTANTKTPPNEKIKPIYSNWEAYTVTE